MSLEPVVVPMRVQGNRMTIPMSAATAVRPRYDPDYETLRHKPSINGVTLLGDMTSADLGIDRTYVHEQNVASDVWSVAHGLDKYPSVSVVDSAGTVVVGDVRYLDGDHLEITFTAPFIGTAYLN